MSHPSYLCIERRALACVHTSTTTEPICDFPAIVRQVCKGRVRLLVNSPARALRLIRKEPKGVINRLEVNVCNVCVLLAMEMNSSMVNPYGWWQDQYSCIGSILCPHVGRDTNIAMMKAVYVMVETKKQT
jgi:hypothetical protein